jgi:ABC-type transport system involved in multi-copper enzyme maturation permease subunit
VSGDTRPAPFSTLTRHFFQGFFRLTFLDDAGEESFRRAMIGVLSGIVAFGLLLLRLYLGKYAGLPNADVYRVMVQADRLLMISLPMLVTAFAIALVSRSLFPDETDFRILMALPVPRRTIFAAKLTALFLFAAIFIICANVVIGLPFALVSGGRWAESPLLDRALAQAAAGTLASIFAVAAIVAIQGLITVIAPQSWLRGLSVGTQTVMVCGLVLSLPFVDRIPTIAPSLHAKASWLYFVAPAWFLGVQQWLLGSREPYFVRLALMAIVGTAATALIAAGCYLALYRRFDRVVVDATRMGRRARHPPLSWPRWLPTRHPAYEAVQAFTGATLRRSSLHQLVCFGIFAAGSALTANSVLGNVGSQERFLIGAVLRAPLTLIVATVVGLREAMLLPANLKAAWVFQFTEAETSRRHQMNAIRDTLGGAGVLAPAALVFPVQAAVLGLRSALAGLPVIVLLGWMFVEVVLGNWRRIPFTCTVLFAKRPAAHTVLIAILVLFWLVPIGGVLEQVAISGLRPWLVVTAILLLICAGLRWVRLQSWGRLPLEFEDYLPDTIEPLGLR